MIRFDGGRGGVEGGGRGMYQSTLSAKVLLEPVFCVPLFAGTVSSSSESSPSKITAVALTWLGDMEKKAEEKANTMPSL